jgi:hypothetical protein
MFTLNNITKNEELNYLVTSLPCPACKSTTTIVISPDSLYKYNQGGLAQDILVSYSPDVRERFISGYCGKCWYSL